MFLALETTHPVGNNTREKKKERNTARAQENVLGEKMNVNLEVPDSEGPAGEGLISRQ